MNSLRFPPITLALDFGTKRIGVAISRGTLAEPLVILESTPAALEQLRQICREERVVHVIVGLSEGEMAEKTKAWAEELRIVLGLPMEFVDETLSSHTVHRQNLESGKKQRDRSQPIDHLAAAEVLREWLGEWDG